MPILSEHRKLLRLIISTKVILKVFPLKFQGTVFRRLDLICWPLKN